MGVSREVTDDVHRRPNLVGVSPPRPNISSPLTSVNSGYHSNANNMQQDRSRINNPFRTAGVEVRGYLERVTGGPGSVAVPFVISCIDSIQLGFADSGWGSRLVPCPMLNDLSVSHSSRS